MLPRTRQASRTNLIETAFLAATAGNGARENVFVGDAERHGGPDRRRRINRWAVGGRDAGVWLTVGMPLELVSRAIVTGLSWTWPRTNVCDTRYTARVSVKSGAQVVRKPAVGIASADRLSWVSAREPGNGQAGHVICVWASYRLSHRDGRMDGWTAAGPNGGPVRKPKPRRSGGRTQSPDSYLHRVSRFPFITEERVVSLRVRDSLVESALRSRETAAVLPTTTVYNYQISAMILTSHSDATA